MKPDEQPVAHGDEVRQQIGQALLAIAKERGMDPGWVYGEALVHASVTLTAVGKEAEAKHLFDVARKAGRIVKTQVDAQTRADQCAVLLASEACHDRDDGLLRDHDHPADPRHGRNPALDGIAPDRHCGAGRSTGCPALAPVLGSLSPPAGHCPSRPGVLMLTLIIHHAAADAPVAFTSRIDGYLLPWEGI